MPSIKAMTQLNSVQRIAYLAQPTVETFEKQTDIIRAFLKNLIEASGKNSFKSAIWPMIDFLKPI